MVESLGGKEIQKRYLGHVSRWSSWKKSRSIQSLLVPSGHFLLSKLLEPHLVEIPEFRDNWVSITVEKGRGGSEEKYILRLWNRGIRPYLWRV